MPSGIHLTSHRLALRPADPSDAHALTDILQEPEVSRWWPGFDRGRVLRELIEEDDELTVCVIEHGGRVIGAIQFSEVTDPDYRHAGIDLFLRSDACGQGLGPEAIETVVQHLFQSRGHHRIAIDPAADNVRAIRAYEKAKFRRVGVLEQYERGPDGTWRDGVLMERVRSPRRRTAG